MPPKWFKNEEKENEEKQRANIREDVKGVELKPELIADAVKPHMEAMRTQFSTEIDEKMKGINDFITEQNRIRAEAARRTQQENENPDELDYLSDPSSAIDKKLAPLIRSQQAANAMLMINETLGGMDYYASDPEFKAKVLAKINSQPLALRSNADIILNCYKLVRFDEDTAIKDGKYKSILGAASTNGTGGHSGAGKKEEEITISDEEKVYAKKMGIKEEDWVKSKKTLEYV